VPEEEERDAAPARADGDGGWIGVGWGAAPAQSAAQHTAA
jgi:hypothetical protein